MAGVGDHLEVHVGAVAESLQVSRICVEAEVVHLLGLGPGLSLLQIVASHLESLGHPLPTHEGQF